MIPENDGKLTREPRVTASDIFTEAELLAQQEAAQREGRCGSLDTSTGLPCRRRPKYGHTLCPTHERRVPKSREEAERLLAYLRMPALEACHTVIEQWQSDPCGECGYPLRGDNETHRTIIAMAKLILDRSGFGPRATLEVSSKRDLGVPLERMTAAELEELDRVLAAMDALKERVNARLAGEGLAVVDAEVVEEKTAEPLAIDGAGPVVSGKSA